MGKNESFNDNFYRFYNIIVHLRGPEGCPWDKKQNARSLRRNIIEEAFECIDAIDKDDEENLKEELGDLLLVILMIIRVKEQERKFKLNEVIDGICDKLIYRHPHVFGGEKVANADEAIKKWEKLKSYKNKGENAGSVLDKVPKSLLPMEKAYLIQKKVSKVGFDWKTLTPLWNKLEEEVFELKESINSHDNENSEIELGDILFTVINIGRFLNISPSLALNKTNKKFIKRFQELEKRLNNRGITLDKADIDVMDSIWNEIKSEE